MSELCSKRGKISALSHIFYIHPKSLFMELSTNKTQSCILISNRDHLTKWKDLLRMRQWIEINNLKSVKIQGHSDLIFETTPNSELIIVEKEVIAKIKRQTLISYQGKVTDDSWASYGFYTLDDTVTLCLSYVKLVSNVPIVKKADNVVLHEVHHVKIEDHSLLFMCGRGNLSNLSVHEENTFLFPRSPKSDSENSLQHVALDYNCDIFWLFSLFNLTRNILKRFFDIVPCEDLVRKSISGNNKGILTAVFEFLRSYFTKGRRSLTKEFLDHDSSCVTGIQVKGFNKEIEPYNKVEDWGLNSCHIEAKCNQLKLWSSLAMNVANESPQNNIKTNMLPNQIYWKHDTATVDSTSRPVIVLFGILTFQNGLWILKDNTDSICCVLADRMHHQFKDRCVFATKFHVHREIFSSNDGEGYEKQIYLSINELHAASLPMTEPKLPSDQQSTKETVRFLVLSKSMPLMIFSNETVKRHLFGFFITAAVFDFSQPDHSENPGKTKKLKLDRETGLPDELMPANCVLAFSHQHSCAGFSDLNEGRVYEICASKQELLKQRIRLPSLKDIPHSALRNYVYMVPDHVGVFPITYNLPKTESYMHKDVLSVEECLALEDVNPTTISLRGWIVDRMHVEPKFGSELQKFEVHQGNWLGIPGNKKLVLKIGRNLDSGSYQKIDVYISLSERQLYPFGLFKGSEVELTWLCLRKTRTTSRIYCTSTVLTGIRFHQISSNEGCGQSQLELLKDSCIGRCFLSQLQSAKTRNVCSIVGTVRYIHKLSISCICFGCKSDIKHGVCSYVGCHWSGLPRTKIDLKAWCTVEDGTGQALIFIAGESCYRWLHFPQNVWKVLEEQVLPHEGEFVYLSTRTTGKETSVACEILSYYCTASAHLRRPVYMTVRKMFDNEVKPSSAYYFRDQPSLRLFCLDLKEVDPTNCALELIPRRRT